MSLTPEDVRQLCAAFRRDDHEFIEGRTYLSEDAITARIETVDINWAFEIQEAIAYGDSIAVRAVLTINGVSRAGVGGNPVQREGKEWDNKKWTGNYIPLSQYAVAENGVNAYKAAATDALKRCARLFGIGRYLLDAPKKATPQDFNAWLSQKQKELGVGGIDTATGEIVTTPPQQPAPPAVEPATPEPANIEFDEGKAGSVEPPTIPASETDAKFDDAALTTRSTEQPALGLVDKPEATASHKWVVGEVKNYVILEKAYCSVSAHFDNLIADLYKRERINDNTTTEGVIAEIDDHYKDGHHLKDKKKKAS